MKHIKETEIEGESFSEPYARVIKHLVAPWTVGSSNCWVGTTTLPGGSSSNPHLHEQSEEVFYVVLGTGQARVGEEVEDIGPGSCVFVPPNTLHQLLNNSDTELKVLAVTSPPFSQTGFKTAHNPK